MGTLQPNYDVLNIGTTNNHQFPFWTNGKVVVLGVLLLKHFRYYFNRKRIVDTYVVNDVTSTRQSVIKRVVI